MLDSSLTLITPTPARLANVAYDPKEATASESEGKRGVLSLLTSPPW